VNWIGNGFLEAKLLLEAIGNELRARRAIHTEESDGMSRLSSPYRNGPSLRRARLIGFHLPPSSSSESSTAQPNVQVKVHRPPAIRPLLPPKL
jgi:hypothetical protein